MNWTSLFFAAALALSLTGGGASAREAGVADGVVAKELLEEQFAGDPSKEVVTHTYSFPAGAVLPWHIHPDAHEIAYVLEGDFVMEIEGEGRKPLKSGESFYLAPNLVHRGLNEGTEPVKLFVVRIKPKDKPLAEDVAR